MIDKTGSAGLVVLAAFLLGALPTAAVSDVPEVSHDGLELIDSDRLQYVYVRPGAVLEPYTRVAILDTHVAFRKNWAQDYNRNAMAGVSRRVSPTDMEKIKAAVAEQLKASFTEVLQQGGYEIVTEGGENVLVLKPAIINLDVAAPQVSGSAQNRVVVDSAGSATLFLELYDSVTGEIIARAIDSRRSDRGGVAFVATRLQNRAEARKIFGYWAGVLRDALDRVEPIPLPESGAGAGEDN